MHYGVVDANNDLVHYVDVPLPGPRLPHDMAFTENYAILNDFPLFWDPEVLRARRAPAALPPRHAVPLRGHPAPRRTRGDPVVRGRPDLRPALHQRLRGRRRDRARRLLPGRPEPGRQRRRATSGSGPSASSRSTGCRPGCTAGGSTSCTGEAREEQLSRQHHRVRHDQRRLRRAASTATPTRRPASRAGSCSTAWSSTTCETGAEERFAFDDGVYGSETAMAPRVGSTGRGRRLPGHHHHRHERRRVLLPGVRRRARRRRTGLQTGSARTDLERHPLDLGAGLGAAALAARPTPPPRRSACS